MGNDYVIKRTKNMNINPYNGLTRQQGFNLEKDCLTLLRKNYKCYCNKNYIDLLSNRINGLSLPHRLNFHTRHQ